MRHLKLLSLLLLAACLASGAEQAGLAGPVSGVLFDPQTKAIRPMVGVPGAAYLGGAFASGLEQAAVSPSGKLALAVAQGRTLLIAIGAESRSRALEGALEGASRIVWIDASSAVLAGAGRVQLWRSLDAAPELAAAGDLGGEILALAASSDSIVAAVRGGVYQIRRDAPARLLAAFEDPSALAVWERDLFVADRERGEIAVVRNFETGAGAEFFARFAGTAGLAAADGLLFAASREARTLSAFRIAGGETAGEVALDFEPTGIERLSGPLFLLNRGGELEPFYVLDSSQGLAVYFVPAGAVSITEE